MSKVITKSNPCKAENENEWWQRIFFKKYLCLFLIYSLQITSKVKINPVNERISIEIFK